MHARRTGGWAGKAALELAYGVAWLLVRPPGAHASHARAQGTVPLGLASWVPRAAAQRHEPGSPGRGEGDEGSKVSADSLHDRALPGERIRAYQKLDIREEEYDCEPEQAPVVGGHYVQFTSLHYV